MMPIPRFICLLFSAILCWSSTVSAQSPNLADSIQIEYLYIPSLLAEGAGIKEGDAFFNRKALDSVKVILKRFPQVYSLSLLSDSLLSQLDSMQAELDNARRKSDSLSSLSEQLTRQTDGLFYEILNVQIKAEDAAEKLQKTQRQFQEDLHQFSLKQRKQYRREQKLLKKTEHHFTPLNRKKRRALRNTLLGYVVLTAVNVFVISND